MVWFEIAGPALAGFLLCSVCVIICCYSVRRRKEASPALPRYEEFFSDPEPTTEFMPPVFDPALIPKDLDFSSKDFESVTGKVVSVYEYEE
jgi:hypothetical protein